jgi:RNA polymerase sigma factor (sigma-70 family)
MPISSLQSSTRTGMATSGSSVSRWGSWGISIGAGTPCRRRSRALRSRGDLRRIESVSGWLWRMLVNVCLADKRHPSDRFGVSEEAAANGHADEWPEVRAMVAALPERQRLVLFLRHYADLDYRQIAEVVGVERGTVAATLHTAHQKIREAMTEVQA